MSEPPRAKIARRPVFAITWCAAMIVTFAATSYFAVLGKSATFDEPMHAMGAWVHLHRFDFRVNYEDPPLWHYWAALPNGPRALTVDWATYWNEIPDRLEQQWPFAVHTLYETPGNDGAAFVNRSRAMMVMIGMALGATVSLWTWRIAGPLAASVATTLLCLDPNFLAHAALIKNDIAMALVMTFLAWALWRLGQRVTWRNALASALLVGAGLTAKFSGVLLAPIVVIVLGARVLLPAPWRVGHRSLTTRGVRSLLAAAVVALIAIISYASIWAAYGFRFSAIPGGEQHISIAHDLELCRRHEVWKRHPDRPPSDLEVKSEPTPLAAVMIASAIEHRVLPEAWLAGLLYVQARSQIRSSFLLGENSVVGWWYYFPLAMLIKTPLATLLAGAAAACVGVVILHRASPAQAWTTLCLALPPALYLASAMQSNLNIGLRHVLPVYPFAFVGIGIAAAAMWRRRPRVTGIALGVLGLALAAETAAIAPDFITFFNFAAGGPRGGLRLLADSNLDWGQDLPLLAAWQREHPKVPLYFSYFGTVDPRFYGIRYVNLPGGYPFAEASTTLPPPGSVIAISASKAQGISVPDSLRDAYRIYLTLKPAKVLGGSIYLFNVDESSEAPK